MLGLGLLYVFLKGFMSIWTDIDSACLSSIIRITYIPNMLYSEDQTYAITGAMYWSVIETNIGILAASIPSFKVIAKRYSPRLLGSSYESNRYPSKSSKSGHLKAGSSGFHKMGGWVMRVITLRR